MRAKDLRHLSEDELATRLADTRKELFNLRFQSATGGTQVCGVALAARRARARTRSAGGWGLLG